jgi:hypothetical protein
MSRRIVTPTKLVFHVGVEPPVIAHLTLADQ